MAKRYPRYVLPALTRSTPEVIPLHMLDDRLLVYQLALLISLSVNNRLARIVQLRYKRRLVLDAHHTTARQQRIQQCILNRVIKLVRIDRIRQGSLKHLRDSLAHRVSITEAPPYIRLRRGVVRRWP